MHEKQKITPGIFNTNLETISIQYITSVAERIGQMVFDVPAYFGGCSSHAVSMETIIDFLLLNLYLRTMQLRKES